MITAPSLSRWHINGSKIRIHLIKIFSLRIYKEAQRRSINEIPILAGRIQLLGRDDTLAHSRQRQEMFPIIL